MERTAAGALCREGFPGTRQKHERSVGCVTRASSFELDINRRRKPRCQFSSRARETLRLRSEANVVEIVSARVPFDRDGGKKLAERRVVKRRPGSFEKRSYVWTAYLGGKRLA